jgi:hypothetical protein
MIMKYSNNLFQVWSCSNFVPDVSRESCVKDLSYLYKFGSFPNLGPQNSYHRLILQGAMTTLAASQSRKHFPTLAGNDIHGVTMESLMPITI